MTRYLPRVILGTVGPSIGYW